MNNIDNAIQEFLATFKKLAEVRKNNKDCYCHDIFEKWVLTNLNTFPQYTWQWNFTEEEYKSLKILLIQHAALLPKIIKQNKICCKLLQLYVSEWYKRDFNGNDKKGNAYSSIGIANISEEICKQLGIDEKKVYHDNADGSGRCRWEETIYVDGGLPLKYLLTEQKGQKFTQSILGIIKKSDNEQYDIECDLGELCDNGVVNQSYQGRILHPDEDEASIFDFIQETIINESLVIDGFEGLIYRIRNAKKKAEIEIAHRKPFSFRWLFDFDDNRKTVDIYFEMSGAQTLSDLFIQNKHLETASFVSVSVKCNNEVLYTVEYDESHYCRRKVYFRSRYIMGSVITIEIEETGDVLSSHELDLSDPKILSLLDLNLNCYTLCDSKKMATTHCRIISSTDWSSDGQVIETKTYQIKQEPYHVFFIIPSIVPVVLTTGSEIKTFDPKIPLCWTVIDDSCHITLDGIQTKETLYNVSEMRFFKGKEDSVVRIPQPVKFSAYRSRNWNDTPKLGEIRARIDLDNSESVDPVKFLNVGNLSIIRENSNSDSCTIRIIWNEGTVTSVIANSLRNNCFLINRARLKSRYVSFVFTPSPGTGDTFTIHVAPPFFDFKFLNPYSNEVSPNSLIPMVDLHNYRYYLVGNCVNLRFGQSREEHLQYNNIDGGPDVTVSHIRDTDGQRQPRPNISNESWLTTFFDGTNTIRNLLEKDTRPLTESIAKIRLYRNGSSNFSQYYFKDFPYRIAVTDDVLSVENVVYLPNGNENNELLLPPYRGALLATPIDAPTIAPVKIEPIDNKFVIPDKMKNCPQKQWLVYGVLQGLILPKLIDLGCSLSDEDRANLKRENLGRYKDALREATIFDEQWTRALDWYDLIFQGNIPGSSMLTLVAIADDQELLSKFAIQLFIKNFKSLKEGLAENMLEFQRQMEFLWAWVHIDVVGLKSFVDFKQPYHIDYYNEWELKHNSDNFISIEKQTAEELDACCCQLIDDFCDWVKDLQKKSIPKPLYLDPKLNSLGDGLQTQQARDFFNQIPVDNSLPPYKKWISQRYKFHEMANQIDIFDLECSPSVMKEIHRSIIYGLKFINE